MPRIAYINRWFSNGSKQIIEHANEIIGEYLDQGFDLTLRQLYYQFVARDLIANKQSEYKRIGSIVNYARLAGLIDWDAIVDRTRSLRSLAHWTSPGEIIAACASQYRIDKWAPEFQKYRPEVWIEKDALTGVIRKVCNNFDVPYFSTRGYTSQSEAWAAGHHRIKGCLDRGQTPIIIHLGDHDPSGLDMTRDIGERINLFAGDDVEVRRIGLNMDQVHKFNPPPNPAKTTDSRATWYIAEFGHDSWELDALEPRVISDLISDTIMAIRDESGLLEANVIISKARKSLNRIASDPELFEN